MRKMLTYALSVLTNPSVTVVAEPSPVRGTWTVVTPTGIDLVNKLACENYGSITMLADPVRPSDIFTQIHCQGVWKSVDYGLTWFRPDQHRAWRSRGQRSRRARYCARGSDGQPPILYSADIRGTGIGFWKSTGGGVSWTNYRVAPGGDRQDFYPPAVDPWDTDHLIMSGHDVNLIVQNRDGGRTWSSVQMANGTHQSGGTGFLFFINTGNAATTAKSYSAGHRWGHRDMAHFRRDDLATVDGNEHPHGQMQIYQPDTSGVVYMPGIYSKLGSDVLRSTDYGETWTRVDIAIDQAAVFGTPRRVYAMYAWACGGCKLDPALQSAPQLGISGWACRLRPKWRSDRPRQRQSSTHPLH